MDFLDWEVISKVLVIFKLNAAESMYSFYYIYDVFRAKLCFQNPDYYCVRFRDQYHECLQQHPMIPPKFIPN